MVSGSRHHRVSADGCEGESDGQQLPLCTRPLVAVLMFTPFSRARFARPSPFVARPLPQGERDNSHFRLNNHSTNDGCLHLSFAADGRDARKKSRPRVAGGLAI